MDETAFPPADLHAFLTLCVGSWMSLRSRFDLNGPEDDWHSSDRGEVTVSLDGQADDAVLSVQPADGAASKLRFRGDGDLVVAADERERSGRWQLRADSSLELVLNDVDSAATVLERIWFGTAKLRLSSTTAIAMDGTPLQARFCSEIRRVSSPQH